MCIRDRLVTVVGPGGIGKSRLALQAAADQVGAFAHGIALVPLAPVNGADLLASAIADALDVHTQSSPDPEEQLLNYLRDREMLLVLDNFEHLIAGSPLLSRMLRQAPGLVLLVTSRERLKLLEEWGYEIGGLTYPPGEGDVPADQAYSAVALFEQRARQANRHFCLSDEERPHVVRICRIVEGMPLGVELAAAWVNERSCEEIAREIEQNRDMLTTRLRNVPPRHQSVWATFEYSWQLLSEPQRDALARLSVFRGGFRREAATAVTGASPATLSALVDKSLIRRMAQDRYGMHSLLQQYAAERLEDDPQQLFEAQTAHVCHYGALLERQEPRLVREEQKEARRAIAVEIENARQAWRLAVARDDADWIAQSLESMFQFHVKQCRYQEGADLFSQAVARWRETEEREDVLGRLLVRQGMLYRFLFRYQEAQDILEEGLAILERLPLPEERVLCLIGLTEILRRQGNYQEAKRVGEAGLDLARQIQAKVGVARLLAVLGVISYRIGDVDQARGLLEEGLATGRGCGMPYLITPALNALGDVMCHVGDYAGAQAAFEECLALSRGLGDQFNIGLHLNNLGTVLHHLEQYSQAERCYRESLEICCQIGDRNGQAMALSNLGEVAHALGNPHEAMAHYQEALDIGRAIEDRWTILACLNNLGELACSLEDHAGAKACFAEALQNAVDAQIVPVLFKILVNLAVLFAQQGQDEWAARLLDLAATHPGSERATQERANTLMSELGLAGAETHGDTLDVLVQEVLAEIAPGSPGESIDS